VIMNQNPN